MAKKTANKKLARILSGIKKILDKPEAKTFTESVARMQDVYAKTGDAFRAADLSQADWFIERMWYPEDLATVRLVLTATWPIEGDLHLIHKVVNRIEAEIVSPAKPIGSTKLTSNVRLGVFFQSHLSLTLLGIDAITKFAAERLNLGKAVFIHICHLENESRLARERHEKTLEVLGKISRGIDKTKWRYDETPE